MLERVHAHLRANVVGYLALAVALGGTGAYAADKIASTHVAANAIHSRQIANGQVKGVDVAANTLTGQNIDESTLGKVPSAAQADSAGSATTAQSAATAASAQNADTLDNLDSTAFKLSCPAGTQLVAGLCFETAERAAATYDNALNACGDANRRLPSPGELRAYMRAPGVNLGATFEMTDGFFNDYSPITHPPKEVVIAEAGASSDDTSTTYPYRCVTGPSN